MNKPIKTKRFIQLTWLLLCFLSFGLYSLYWWQDQRMQHSYKHTEISSHIAQLQGQADSALESFAAFQSRVDFPTDPSLRPFAQLLLHRNPHIYCLQVVQRVPHTDVFKLESRMREAGYSEFSVHGFDYANTRSKTSLIPRETHFPIVFMEPSPREAQSVLGLDVEAVHFLSPQLKAAGEKAHSLSTAPFRLIEGDIAYGMTIPAYQLGGQQTDLSWPVYAGLVVKAKSLMPEMQGFPAGWQLEFNYTGTAPAEQKQLFHTASTSVHPLEAWLFPRIEMTTPVASNSQSYALTTRQQLTWQSWQGPGPLMLAIFLSLLLLLAMRWHYAERLRRIAIRRHKNQMHRWATQDPLTLCANRQSFDRHMQRAKESDQPFTLLYIDLDNFKPINDHYGHAVGDAVLIEVARRLRQAVRRQDLVARWGGDEFAILAVGLSDPERIESLQQSLLTTLRQPFHWQGQILSMSASLGLASYPQETADLADLLLLADQRMYQHKANLKSAHLMSIITRGIAT